MNKLLGLTVCAFFGTVAPLVAAEPFTLKDGDRVVLIGNTLIEREQRYGYWELALTARFPGVTFRNLGWSGDTVWGEARAVLARRPTVSSTWWITCWRRSRRCSSSATVVMRRSTGRRVCRSLRRG